VEAVRRRTAAAESEFSLSKAGNEALIPGESETGTSVLSPFEAVEVALL
jgi:hypothetical protein